jgi:hypothetical protein
MSLAHSTLGSPPAPFGPPSSRRQAASRCTSEYRTRGASFRPPEMQEIPPVLSVCLCMISASFCNLRAFSQVSRQPKLYGKKNKSNSQTILWCIQESSLNSSPHRGLLRLYWACDPARNCFVCHGFAKRRDDEAKRPPSGGKFTRLSWA